MAEHVPPKWPGDRPAAGRPVGRPAATTASRPPMPALELRGRVEQLKAQNESVARRNVFLYGALAAGTALLLLVLASLYQVGVRSYAVLDNVQVLQDPTNQGRLDISFNVVAPGQVYYRRTSGAIQAELVDVYQQAGPASRSWSWIYEPGENVDLFLRHRDGLLRTSATQTFPTSNHADIVIVMDTTASMDVFIHLLNERCGEFAQKLSEQDLRYRFALIGFGDTKGAEWIKEYPFTEDVEEFKRNITGLQRYDGLDFPESALDALEQALKVPFSEGSLRRMYLVTDNKFHTPTQSGSDVHDVARTLKSLNVQLSVFTVPRVFDEYAPLRTVSEGATKEGDEGNLRLLELEEFGRALSEGRIIED